MIDADRNTWVVLCQELGKIYEKKLIQESLATFLNGRMESPKMARSIGPL